MISYQQLLKMIIEIGRTDQVVKKRIEWEHS